MVNEISHNIEGFCIIHYVLLTSLVLTNGFNITWYLHFTHNVVEQL